MKKTRYALLLIFWILIWFFGYATIQEIHWPNTSNYQSNNADYTRFNEVLDILKTNYYNQEKLNTGAMLQNAIKAYVDGIDDPYTIYMDAEANSWFQEDLKWEADFEWIGAVISKKDYYILIDEVIKDSPAFKAWIMPLDRIVMINTWSTKDLTIEDAVKEIRGPKGSKVSIIIERTNKDQNKELLEKEVIRDTISVPSVSSSILTGKDNKKLWYINISIIWEETENLLKLEIQKIKEEDIQWIILDLRGNGWWFLPIAVEIASHFVPKNKLIVSAKYRQLWEEEFYSKWYKDLQWLATVVLMDNLTASAGEIIALALKEQINAKLIGTQTFGKGSIQTIEDFDDGASIKYTIGKRYSPSDKNIDTVWIIPDTIIEFDAELYKNTNKDNQLEKAIDTL